LSLSLRKALINLLGTVQCNGESAFKKPYVIGAGSPVSLMRTLAGVWSTSAAVIEYYPASSTVAKQQLVDLTEHFGVVSTGLSTEWTDQVPDMTLMPAFAYAMSPGTTPGRLYYYYYYYYFYFYYFYY
jgi:hypothetical protein